MDDDPSPLALDAPPVDDRLALAMIVAFIARWADATGTERANYQLFLAELCTLFGLTQPAGMSV